MPDNQSHLKQAVSNSKFYNEIQVIEGYYDWKVTVIFYEAVHRMRAWITHKNPQSSDFKDHSGVEQSLRRLNCPRHLRKAYKQLKALSEKSRYSCVPVTEEDLKDALEYLRIIVASVPNPKFVN